MTWRRGHTRTDARTGQKVNVAGHPMRTRAGEVPEEALASLAVQATLLAERPADVWEEDAPATGTPPTIEEIAASIRDVRGLLDGYKPYYGWVLPDGSGCWHAPAGTHVTIAFVEQRLTAVGAQIAELADARAAPEIARIRASYEGTYGDLDEALSYVATSLVKAREQTKFWSARAREDDSEEARRQLALWNQAVLQEREAAIDTERELALRNGEILAATRSSTLEVLGELRPLGLPAEGLRGHPSSQRPATKLFEQAAKVYPTAWLERSNRCARLLLFQRTRKRAHYRHRDDVTVYDAEGPNEGRRSKNQRYPDEPPPVPGAEASFDWRKRRMVWNWTERYRTDQVSQITTGMKACALPGAEPGFTTATHELVHRAERLHPLLGVMEAQFIRRRAADPETGHLPQEQSIGAVEGETGHPDGFVIPYAGRIYPLEEESIFAVPSPPGEDGVSYEILSVGAEGVFAGQFGGLVGQNGWKPDPDHRAFVLGAWATI